MDHTSPRPSLHRFIQALAFAAVVFLLLNIGVGLRLSVLLQDTAIGQVRLLEERIAAHPRPEAVRILVLGNSLAQVGLRPAQLAEVLALPPDAVFSLALPGASPQEMRILYERHHRHFPEVRLVLCAVDSLFFATDFEGRLRYLTRESLQERWRYARRHGGLESRISLAVSAWFPLADFNRLLWDELSANPALFARRLATDPPTPAGAYRQLARAPYPWGVPSELDLQEPAKLALFRYQHQRAAAVIERASTLKKLTRALPSTMTEFAELIASVKRTKTELALVEMPSEPRKLWAMTTLVGGPYRDYEARLAAVLRAESLALIEPPGGWSRAHFYDADHLLPVGGRREAQWLARRLPARLRDAIAGQTP